MSTAIMAQCWPMKMPPTAKAVLISLADNANDSGFCWPSLTTICERTCFGRTAVIEAIKWLEESGVVSVSRDAKCNRYQIHTDRLPAGASEYHYVYRITHEPSGMFYIGLRSTASRPEDDDYFGSGKDASWLLNVRSECVKEVLFVAQSRKEAAEEESSEIAKNFLDPKCLNRRISSPEQSQHGPQNRFANRTVREADGTAGGLNGSGGGPNESGRRTSTVREADTNRKEPSRTVIEATAKKRARAPSCPEGVDPQTWADWLTLRKAKKAPVTETVVKNAKAEAAKAGLTLGQFLAVWCARGSQGLQAEWLKPNERGPPAGRVPVNASFRDKTYEGDTDDELPDFLRAS